jgi:hypothetical protein
MRGASREEGESRPIAVSGSIQDSNPRPPNALAFTRGAAHDRSKRPIPSVGAVGCSAWLGRRLTTGAKMPSRRFVIPTDDNLGLMGGSDPDRTCRSQLRDAPGCARL